MGLTQRSRRAYKALLFVNATNFFIPKEFSQYNGAFSGFRP
jgi:hypothetical protein